MCEIMALIWEVGDGFTTPCIRDEDIKLREAGIKQALHALLNGKCVLNSLRNPLMFLYTGNKKGASYSG